MPVTDFGTDDMAHELLDHTTLTTVGAAAAGPGRCAECKTLITDRYYLVAAESCWHIACLKCSECNDKLEEESSCFYRDGFIFCKKDYYKRFSVPCSRCKSPITLKELVMKAKHHTYHMGCFSCSVCDARLSPGEYFGLEPGNGALYCQVHYEPLIYSPCGLDEQSVMFSGQFNIGKGYTSSGSPSKQRCKKRKLQSSLAIHSLSDWSSSSDLMSLQSNSSRAKRMRTSFKLHQLKTMKEYFNLNHNPDAKDLKALAQKTGLTKRVLQVWFQNARAKYRRSMQLAETGADDKEAAETSETEGTGNKDKSNSPVSSTKSESFAPNKDSITDDFEYTPYSPSGLTSMSDDDTVSKSLADYFHQCDIKLL